MRVAKLRKLGRPIVPRDLRNPDRKSGYDYVGHAGAPGPRGGGGGARWSARQGAKVAGSGPKDWTGPRRKDPRDAAQDFCDHFNGNPTASTHSLVTAGHEYEVDVTDKDPEYQAALGVMRDRKAQRAGRQGYVYLIVEDRPGGALEFGKIGYSTNPRKRVAELQTGNPRTLRLLYMKPGTEAEERRIHQKYIKQNVLQEWFRLTRELIFEWGVQHAVRPERKAA
jgi:Meiotically up-regulated gene 113